MSRVSERRLYWDAPANSGPVTYAVYSGDTGNTNFIAEVDAGNVAPMWEELMTTEILLVEGSLPEGNYQFAVCAVDVNENYSDPYQHPAWANVPLDLTAPNPPTGGGLDII